MPSILSDLSGKTYLVTGASSGIGAATARALGRVGAHVVLAARRKEPCAALAHEIIACGGKALVIPTDVRIESDVRHAVEATVSHFGRIDGAFNNAGELGISTPLHTLESDDFESVLRTNVMGVFWSMRYEIAAMLQTGGGAIVNTASITAHIGFPNLAPYNTSKHAVLGLTRSAALEYFQQGIRINAVAPGPVETPMANIGFGSTENLHAAMVGFPSGRVGQPIEIAQPVLFLLSSAASLISGQSLLVDGGYTAQ